MSSHREAPEISKDPVADSADLYAFVSPDRPDSVTIIANYVPLQGPEGGPNFYEFGDDVLYQINIDNNGDGIADVTYSFTFRSEFAIPSSFLYNDGPILTLDSPAWNRRQFYTVTRTVGLEGKPVVLGANLPCPPCNIGPLSTPNYAKLAGQAVHPLGTTGSVFAGQRADGFYVDLGAIFDLGDLRPIANLHATFGLPKLAATKGVDSTRFLNVHSIAIQVPITELTHGGITPSGVLDPKATVGVWTTASRKKARVWDSANSAYVDSGPWVQISRLGNPLINEVIIPIAKKDYWNRQTPYADGQFLAGYQNPELSNLLPILYPGAFPHLAAFNASKKPRADIVAILLTGIPAGVASPAFQNYTGTRQSDELRLNVAIPPSAKPNILGLIGGDIAGFPNGRRVFDDVVSIELRALAGATLPLVDKSFTADAAIADVSDGLNGSDESYLRSFPYLGLPTSGYNAPRGMTLTHVHDGVSHHHSHEPVLPPSYEGSVVLDVGGFFGALVLYGPADLVGAELEITRRGDPAHVTHSSFRERHLGAGVICAAVYPGLPAGDYDIEGYPQMVRVDGGRVTETELETQR